MSKSGIVRSLNQLGRRTLAFVGGVALTLSLYMVLPLMQTFAKPPAADLMLTSVDAVIEAPPPPAPEEEPEQEPEQEPEPPELEESPPQELLDLQQLELALNPGFGSGSLTGDFTNRLTAAATDDDAIDALFSLSDLDQRPRPIHQPSPRITAEMRKQAPGTVYIIFIVDTDGRVENPIVQRSTNAIFEQPALSAVTQWRFEPGKRGGEPVRFRMRVPITFPAGR